MASFGDYNRVNTNVTAMDAQLSLNKINRDLHRVDRRQRQMCIRDR